MYLCSNCVPGDWWGVATDAGEPHFTDACLAHNASPTISSSAIEVYLGDLLDLYTASESGRTLRKTVAEDWGFPDENVFQNLVRELFPTLPIALASGVELRASNEALEIWSSLKRTIWEERRFFANASLNLGLLRSGLEGQRNTLRSGGTYFRGRLSADGRIFRKGEMGAPPAGLASAGRINPEGIPFLYLADSELTCVSEVRASIGDKVTVGSFSLRGNASVVDLSSVDGVEFCNADSPLASIQIVHLLRMLSRDLALPVSGTSSSLGAGYAYLPTQFLAEFVRVNGFDGIKYPSAMNPHGWNVALFDPSMARPKGRPSLVNISALTPTFSTVPSDYS